MNGKIHGKQILNDTIVKSLNGSTYSKQYLVPNSDLNVTLSIDSESDKHSFLLGWEGNLSLERGGLNNSNFTPSEVLIISSTASSVISSGYKFNDNGDTLNDIWSANKIIDYHKKTRSSFKVGDGQNNYFILEHNLGSKFVIVQIFETLSGDSVETEVNRIDENKVEIFFKRPPLLEEYCVVIN